MNFFSKNNALTIGLVAIIVLGVGYLYFFSGKDEVADVTSVSSAGSPQEYLFVNLSSQLNSIQFDLAILSDPRFMALADLKTEIQPESEGRDDPFAPIPGVRATTKK